MPVAIFAKRLVNKHDAMSLFAFSVLSIRLLIFARGESWHFRTNFYHLRTLVACPNLSKTCPYRKRREGHFYRIYALFVH